MISESVVLSYTCICTFLLIGRMVHTHTTTGNCATHDPGAGHDPVLAFCCSAEAWEGMLAVRVRREWEGWRVEEKGRGLTGEKGEELTSCMEMRTELA